MKRWYWWWCDEIKSLGLWAICHVPMGIGVWVRRKTLHVFLKSFGRNTTVQARFRITNPKCVKIGDHCNFGEGVFITGGGGVSIGNYVGMGPDAKVWSVNHRFDDPDTPWLLQGYEKQAVVIEDDVWLGANCFVMPGVTIGKGAILSAGTICGKSVPPFAIMAGNPGRVIGWRKKPEAPSASDAAPREGQSMAAASASTCVVPQSAGQS